MTNKSFDSSLADAQGTRMEPLAVERFDFDGYAEYEADTAGRCRRFWAADAGVLVHRRFRVPEVYSYGCKDRERSLALQLGALAESKKYRADVPNFLEPWYGIGTVVSCFGAEYVWHENQAPATHPPRQSLAEALEYEPVPVEQTPIGRHTVEMIEYFMEQTRGRVPISLTDTQSPWNIATSVVPVTQLLMEVFENPEGLKELTNRAADLLIAFTQKQLDLLGDAVVWPGHGFASSREFRGLGMSDDNIVMLSPDQYTDLVAPITGRVGDRFGGAVFHSCGDWSRWIEAVRSIPGLVALDGAFSAQTDPAPNPPEKFAEQFAGTGVVVNARLVGDPDTVAQGVQKLWKPGMKLIVVTYCDTPEAQAEAYDRVHEICSG